MTRRTFFALAAMPGGFGKTRQFDVVVYGGTAGGVLAAIAAARGGARVALLEPGRHLGGMVSGGLGRTDMNRQEHVIGGLTRQFFKALGKHYGEAISWTFEPKVAETLFNMWIKDAQVEVFFSQQFASITRNGMSISSLRTRDGSDFEAKVFIDSSYEGDLMKAAGVSYTLGREGRAQYDESLAGRQEFLPGHHQFRVPVSPFDADGKLLLYIQEQEGIGVPGEADKKLQSYCFRLCLTDDPRNSLPIEAPPGYNPARFALVRNYLKALGERATVNDFLGISHLPGRKTDINSGGPVSTNLLGASWAYPEADIERRRRIWHEHLSWAHGLLYLLANDSVVPSSLRADIQRYGLPKDEFVDTGHWPHQLYVREGRRLLGEYFLTQHDLEEHRRKYDSIGMGGYNIDIREVQWISAKVYRFPKVDYDVIQEGYLSQPVEPYEIPYRCLLPRADECNNLLVTSCISASHVAYASFRMEPQYMIVGHSAGLAAAMCVKSGRRIHQIDVPALQSELVKQGQILSWSD